MRARPRPDDRVAEAAQRRLEALVAELGGAPVPSREDTSGSSPLPAEAVATTGSRDGSGGPGRHARRPLPPTQRVASWVGDRVPPAVAGLGVGGRHLAVVGLLLVAGLLLAGWSYVQVTRGPGPSGEVVAPRATGGVGIVPSTEVPAPGATEQGTLLEESGAAGGAAVPTTEGSAAPAEVVVDVEGKVRRPGIAVLPLGSRVVDALEAAGGARPGADLRTLNLARVLVDGEQLLIGVEPPDGVAAGLLAGPPGAASPGVPSSGSSGGTSGAAAPVALVNLNTADQTALETLPGVGPVTAGSILEWRAQNGAFTSVDELLEVSGIGEATLAELAPHVTL